MSREDDERWYYYLIAAAVIVAYVCLWVLTLVIGFRWAR